MGSYPAINDREYDLIKRIATNTADLSSSVAGDVASVAGTTNQVLVNGTTSPKSGVLTLSLPAALNATATSVFLPSTATLGLQLYNTVDQTTNYERVELIWSANIATLQAVKGGTGTQQAIVVRAGNTSSLNLGNDGNNSIAGTPTTVASATKFTFNGVGSNALSGTNVAVLINPVYNQASGNAANTDFLVNRTQTLVGSGAQLLMDLQVGGATKLNVDNNGSLTSQGNGLFLSSIRIGNTSASGLFFQISNTARSSASMFQTDGGANRLDANTLTDTAASGTVAAAVATSIGQTTFAASNATTITDAACLYINSGPANGTNVTITNSWGLWNVGNTRLDGQISQGAKTIKYNNILTTGWGQPAIYNSGRITAQSANATIGTYTVGAADGSFRISANMNVTGSTTLVTTLTCTYTDESNTARTLVLPVSSLNGTMVAAGAISGAGATVWHTPAVHIRCKASTAITILTSAGTFTGVTYTAECSIQQIA